MKRALWLVLPILLVLIGIKIYSSRVSKAAGADQQQSERAIPVEISPIEQRSIQDIGHFSGSLKPKSGYTVSPKVSARLNKLLVDLGDRVTNGQLIAVLEDDVFVQQLEQARAALAVVEAQVEQARLAYKAAEANWRGVKSLYDQNYSSQAIMDQTDAEQAAAKARYDITLAEVQRARSVVRTAEIQLSYTQIRATWNGGAGSRIVGERFVDEGTLLSINTPILTLIDYSSVVAEIDVIERDYHRVGIGQAVEIRTDAYPNRTFSGRLARLASVLQESSRQARAEIEIPNPDRLLKPGMFVRVQTIYSSKSNVPAVPKAAIVRRGNRMGVFVVDEAKSRASFVEIVGGISDGEYTEVLSPQLQGSVVTLGQDQLQDGRLILLSRPAEAKPGGAQNGRSRS